MATLYTLHPDLPEQEFWFDPTTVDIIIGSDPSCQVVVNHPTIAPQHTRIVQHEGYVWVQDLETSFGTYKHGEAISSVYLETEKSYHFTLGQVELIIFLNHKDQTIQQTQPVQGNTLRSKLLVGNQQTVAQSTVQPVVQPAAAVIHSQIQNQTAHQVDQAQQLQAAALKRAQIRKKKKSSGGAGFFIFILAIVAFAAGLYFKHEQLGTGQNLLHAIQEPAKHYELIEGITEASEAASKENKKAKKEAKQQAENSMDSMDSMDSMMMQ